MSFLKRIADTFRSVPRDVSLGRNDACWCGSGKKYKRCHLDRDRLKLQNRANS
jgi:uncharacterized protein YecA (UPF0149 family)